MPDHINIPEPMALPSLPLADLLRYEEIIARVVHLLRSVEGAAVGATVKLETVQLDVAGKAFTWQMGDIHRDK